jgi:hypothetical protein
VQKIPSSGVLLYVVALNFYGGKAFFGKFMVVRVRLWSNTRIASTESIRDLNLIAPVELLLEVEEIDSLCVRNPNNSPQFHPELWDKLHRLKGDLKTVNVDGSFTLTIDLIDALRNETQPADFMDVWLKIRSDIVSYVISQTSTE